MKVLVACEYSGIVRDAFLARGHDAISCDILPTESPGPHYQGDVMDILDDGWDLMIAHPPCTYLSYAGIRNWNDKGRIWKRIEALQFFATLWTAPIEKICIENPMGCASPVIAKFSQEIQPYYFGDSESKKTWLWLKNIPLLTYSKTNTLFSKKTSIEPKIYGYHKTGRHKGQPIYFHVAHGLSIDRAKKRAKFWPGIAQAMAEQWG